MLNRFPINITFFEISKQERELHQNVSVTCIFINLLTVNQEVCRLSQLSL
jgi:hypothetical protein